MILLLIIIIIPRGRILHERMVTAIIGHVTAAGPRICFLTLRSTICREATYETRPRQHMSALLPVLRSLKIAHRCQSKQTHILLRCLVVDPICRMCQLRILEATRTQFRINEQSGKVTTPPRTDEIRRVWRARQRTSINRVTHHLPLGLRP